MAGRLSGKVAVLTGTGRGIARAVALRFADEGASVLGCDLDAEAGRQTVDLVRSRGGTMDSLQPLDLMDEQGAEALIEFAVKRFGGIDILFNSARGHRPGTIEGTSLTDWRWTLDHTLGIQFLVSKYAIPHLKARGRGSIIFVASISGLAFGTGFPGNVNCLLPYSGREGRSDSACDWPRARTGSARNPSQCNITGKHTRERTFAISRR